MPLHGKKGLIVGIANEHSIAYGCAEVLRGAGADLAVTYLNAKAEPYVRPLAERLDSPIIVACDIRQPGQLEAVFARIGDQWGRLDFLLHSIAYAPTEDLHRRVTDCSQAGFALAMDVSCHSFIRMAHLAEPLMTEPDIGDTRRQPAGDPLINRRKLSKRIRPALSIAFAACWSLAFFSPSRSAPAIMIPPRVAPTCGHLLALNPTNGRWCGNSTY